MLIVFEMTLLYILKTTEVIGGSNMKSHDFTGD